MGVVPGPDKWRTQASSKRCGDQLLLPAVSLPNPSSTAISVYTCARVLPQSTLGELTALTQTSSWIKAATLLQREKAQKGKGRKEGRRKNGKEGREGRKRGEKNILKINS